MGKRKHEPIEPTPNTTSLHDHLAAVEAQDVAPRAKRHQELRPAVPSLSPAPGIDLTLPNSTYVGTDDEEPVTGRRGPKKDLVMSKRAKQNRDAQRAFRERKAGHIQELEDKVNRLQAVSTAHKQLQIENHVLKQYVVSLQKTCIAASAEVPRPPIGLSMPTTPPVITEAGTAEDARIARMTNSGRFERATSSEVRDISDEAIRQRDADAARKQVVGGSAPNTTADSNIEPQLLVQTARQAAPQAA